MRRLSLLEYGSISTKIFWTATLGILRRPTVLNASSRLSGVGNRITASTELKLGFAASREGRCLPRASFAALTLSNHSGPRFAERLDDRLERRRDRLVIGVAIRNEGVVDRIFPGDMSRLPFIDKGRRDPRRGLAQVTHWLTSAVIVHTPAIFSSTSVAPE